MGPRACEGHPPGGSGNVSPILANSGGQGTLPFSCASRVSCSKLIARSVLRQTLGRALGQGVEILVCPLLSHLTPHRGEVAKQNEENEQFHEWPRYACDQVVEDC